MQYSLQDSLSYLGFQTLESLSLLLPRILGAFSALIIGIMLAKVVRGIIQKLLRAVNFATFINKTPLQLAFTDENLGQHIEKTIAGVFYWLTMLITLYTSVTILGLESLTRLLEGVLGYIPNIVSAALILLFGILLGGWVEGLIKNATKTVDRKSAYFIGKMAGYVVVALTSMTALSELGIAEDFIRILFLGFVGSISLGMALALGLGGKGVVEKILESWYENRSETRQMMQEMEVGKTPSKRKKK